MIITDHAVLTNILKFRFHLMATFWEKSILALTSISDTRSIFIDVFTSLGSSIAFEGILRLMFSPILTKNLLNSANSKVGGSGLVSDIQEANSVKLLYWRVSPDSSFQRVIFCRESPTFIKHIFIANPFSCFDIFFKSTLNTFEQSPEGKLDAYPFHLL